MSSRAYKLFADFGFAWINTFTVKQFIRSVRGSKTIADERAVVQKESAAIRASFREESGDANIRCAKRLLQAERMGLMMYC